MDLRSLMFLKDSRVHKIMKKRISKITDKLIAKGNKISGVDLRYFVSGGIWTSVSIATEALIKFLLVVVFTHVMSQDDFGKYQFYLSVLATLYIFALPGMGTAILQSVAKKHYSSYVYGTRSIVKFGVLGSVVCLFAAVYLYFFRGQIALAFYFIATAFFFPFLENFKTYISFLMGKEDYKKASLYQSIQFIFISGAVILMIIFSKSLNLIILTYLVTTVASNWILNLKVKHDYSKEIKKSKKDKGLFKYGMHLSLMEALPLIASHLDKILLTYFLGFATLTIYMVGQSIAQVSKFAFKPFLRLILPKLSVQKSKLKTYLFLKSKLPLMFGISLVLLMAGVTATPFVIDIFFPDAYDGAKIVAQLLFIAQPIVFLNIVFMSFLKSQKEVKNLYKFNMYLPIIRLVLVLTLLPLFGLMGIVATQIMISYISFGVLMYLSRKAAYDKA